MRVNPVSATGRSNVRRRRPFSGETDPESRTGFAAHLPVPLDPVLERAEETVPSRYRPNSAFLAHLIAAREIDILPGGRAKTVPELCSDAYRSTAALPRRRAAGHVIKTAR